MIRDLVVNLNVGTDLDPAAAFAMSIARRFDAHVAAVAFAYDPALTPAIIDGLSADWLEAQRGENLAAAHHAGERFEAAAQSEGVRVQHHVVYSSLSGAATRFARIARDFDLSVVVQPAPPVALPEDLIFEATLFGSGRPTVVVPYTQNRGLTLGHVLVLWDHSRNAARAVADALPFLIRSETVEIVVVTQKREGLDATAGIAAHLARHEVNVVDVRHLVAPDMDVSKAVLSYAADCGASFIVMGGYGHSRLRQFILGGATSGMLQEMTVPVLMAH